MMLTEENEDLEALRLAALKSLNLKRESQPKLRQSSGLGMVGIRNNIEVIERGQPIISYAHENHMYAKRPVEPRETWNHSIVYDTYSPLTSLASSSILPNVQLSPRSLAFVAENNHILMKRKGEKSPVYYHRSPSPYYHTSSRWSESPPPASGNFSNNSNSLHPPASYYDKNTSTYTKSRNRHTSRSPSPKRLDSRRTRSRSRSPIHKYRKASRTPPVSYNPMPIRNSTYHNYHPTSARNDEKTSSSGNGHRPSSPEYSSQSKMKRYSPQHNIKQKYSPRNSNSPSNMYNNNNNNKKNKDYQNKYDRKSSIKNSHVNKKPRDYHNSNYSNNSSMNTNSTIEKTKNAIDEKDNGIKKSNDKSSNQNQIKKSSVNNEKKYDNSKDKENEIRKENVVEKAKDTKESDIIKKVENAVIKKVDYDIDEMEEEKLLASPDANDSDSSDDMFKNDEIDLFASDDSESENEGRFKSNSTKTEVKPISLSYTKLGQSSTSIGELKDYNASESRSNRYDRSRDSKSSYNRHQHNRHKSNDTSKSRENMFKPTFKSVDSRSNGKHPII